MTDLDGFASIAAVSAAPFRADWRSCGDIRHVFTHFELRLTVHAAVVPVGNETGGGRWRSDWRNAALPSVFAKAIALAIQAFEKRPS